MFLYQTYVLCTQKNHLIETAVLNIGTQKNCFNEPELLSALNK